ncbi:hypothetical protein PINS_up020895 [Pythium insidiosum]|nr:hypothetical protein PINS_up020895 [Pythium insidiosum]
MQTYQAYHLSASVPRRWINQLAVASIVLNCVGTPLVHVVFRRQQGWRRLICLVLDAVLDVCSSVVIPLCVIYPYAFKYFDPTLEYFADALVMDDVWYIDAIAENRQILITSPADYIATVMPQLSILGCLLTVKHVIKAKRGGAIAPTRLQGPSEHSISPDLRVEAVCRPVQRTSMASSASIWVRLRSSVSSTQELPSSQHRVHNRNERFMHAFFLLWAVVIVWLHVDADTRAAHNVRGCRSHLQPWYATKYACSVMQFNCYSRGIQGHADELDAALSKIEPSVLQILTVTHCPALSLPPVLGAFKTVKGVEIFNSTVVSWPHAAAISAVSHKELGYLYLINATWSHFPDGVFHGELPPTLTHLIIHGANFTELPDGLEELWSGRLWVLLAIDGTPLRELRPSFCRLSIYQLSLASTGLKELPPHCLRADVVNINLSGNPMRALPVTESTMRDAQTLMMEYSALEELPDWYERWLAAGGSDTAGFFGAPVCDALLARDGANVTEWIQQTCGTDAMSWAGTYPWPLMLPQRRLDFE